MRPSIRAGWYYDDDNDERVFMQHADGMREALKGYDFDRALSVLEAAGVLPPRGSDGKLARPVRTPEGVKKLYTILPQGLQRLHM